MLIAFATIVPVFLPRPAVPALRAFPALVLPAQISLEAAAADLTSADANVRLKAVQLLKDAAYPEAAVPLAKLVVDSSDSVQFEAIAAELNIFLAEKVVTRKRVGLVVEKRTAIVAEETFAAGPLALGGRLVDAQVLSALRTAMRDDNPRVGLEAIYAFGVLALNVQGAARSDLMRAAGPELSAMLGMSDPYFRFAAARVMGRVFARRPQDDAIDETVGDALVSALNDTDRAVRGAATQALGAMRYDRAVTALQERFAYHKRGDEAESALDALARIANPATAPVLEAQLASKTASVRGMAVEGFARLGDAARLSDLQRALASERAESVQLALAFANTMLANAGLDPISEAVTRSRTHDQARGYLVEIAPGRAGLFSKSLQDPDARIRLAAVDALGLSGDSAAIPLVEPLTADTDPLVARAAASAVERLTPPR